MGTVSSPRVQVVGLSHPLDLVSDRHQIRVMIKPGPGVGGSGVVLPLCPVSDRGSCLPGCGTLDGLRIEHDGSTITREDQGLGDAEAGEHSLLMGEIKHDAVATDPMIARDGAPWRCPLCHSDRWFPGPGGGLTSHTNLLPELINRHLKETCHVLIGETVLGFLDLGIDCEVIHCAVACLPVNHTPSGNRLVMIRPRALRIDSSTT